MTSAALAAAADQLEAEGKEHGWWPDMPQWSWRTADQIGREEFLDLVDRVVAAYLMERMP